MNVFLYSLYWDNIDPAVVAGQKAVFDHFGLALNQHRIQGLNHGEWMDWLLTRMEDVDVFGFIDIDCIPLSRDRLLANVEKAAGGMLVGAEGADNGYQPLRSYAGPWYLFINRKLWDRVGRPSGKAYAGGDVGQMWTETWRHQGLPFELIPPTSSVIPQWDLPGRPKALGTATTYGDECFHLFQARNGNQHYFIDKCREITGRNF